MLPGAGGECQGRVRHGACRLAWDVENSRLAVFCCVCVGGVVDTRVPAVALALRGWRPQRETGPRRDSFLGCEVRDHYGSQLAAASVRGLHVRCLRLWRGALLCDVGLCSCAGKCGASRCPWSAVPVVEVSLLEGAPELEAAGLADH